MAKFRKKPVVIDAVVWRGQISELAPLLTGSGAPEVGESFSDGALIIKTLEGEMRANLGDWIIRSVKGELYPCKTDIFNATYEPADTSAAVEADWDAVCARARGED